MMQIISSNVAKYTYNLRNVHFYITVYQQRENKHQSGGEFAWIQKIYIINNNSLLYLLKRVNIRLILALNTSPARRINCLAAMQFLYMDKRNFSKWELGSYMEQSI